MDACWVHLVKCSLDLDKCPCCRQYGETFAYLLSYEVMKVTRQSAYLHIQMDFTTAKLPISFTTAFVKCIIIALEDKDMPQIFNLKATQDTMESQAKIGFDKFMVGFLANEGWIYWSGQRLNTPMI